MIRFLPTYRFHEAAEYGCTLSVIHEDNGDATPVAEYHGSCLIKDFPSKGDKRVVGDADNTTIFMFRATPANKTLIDNASIGCVITIDNAESYRVVNVRPQDNRTSQYRYRITGARS